MANGETDMVTDEKMIITLDVNTGKIERVEVVIGPERQELKPERLLPAEPEGGYRHIGTLLAFKGSNCVTLNLPGGGSYKRCRP